ncbi:Coiled-coil domain-containing protein, partial [Schistosoma japonicum]
KKFYQKLLNCQTFIELFNEKKLQIKNKQISHLSNVNELQKLLKDIEDMLTEYKQEERMIAETLIQQEIELWQDCLNIEQQINFWENDSNRMKNLQFQNRSQLNNLLTHSNTTTNNHNISSNNLPSEINEFQNFLDKHGGRTGGWSIDEHTKFLKHLKLYKHQCKNALNNHENNQNDKINIHQQNNETKDEIQQQTIKNDDTNKHTTINTTTSDSSSSSSSSSSVVSYNISTFHQEFANIIMNKTPEEVAEHEKWWKEFQRLENAKRVVIQKWSEEKRRKEYQKKNNTDDDNNDAVEIKHNSYAKQQHLSMEQLEARRVELELWRQQRQEMKKQEEELKRQAEIQLKNAQLELKRKRQAKIQQKISLYKQEKMAEKLATLQSLALQTKMEQLNRQAEINKAASRIQQRTVNQLNQLSARKRAKEQTEIPRQELLERIPIQTTIHVTRDPKRLCQLTKGWKLRLAQPKIDNLVNQGLDLSVNTGRMIPKWRRNL